jgi:hypothetical protein
MSDPDAMPDPIDKAYVEAEAVLSDEAARAARRARVLAAVAHQGAVDAATPAVRPRPWRRGGWLVAACVSGLALVVAIQVYRPTPYPPPTRPTAGPATPAVAAKGTVPAPVAPAPALTSAPQRNAPPRAAKAEAGPPPVSAATAPPPAAQSAASAPQAFPSDELAPAAPPPPPPLQADARSPRAASIQPSQPSPPQSAAAGDGTQVTEMVVTAEKRESPKRSAPVSIGAFDGRSRDIADPGERLRAAAAAGRTGDVETILEQGALVDAPDARGDTALMKSIQADRPAAAALLRQHGASLDQKNHAGKSAADMAKAKGDPELNQALGLNP